VDDTFQPAEMVAAFRKLNEVDNIPLLHIYSNATARPCFLTSSSAASHRSGVSAFALANPSKNPYLFSIIPTPSIWQK